MKSASILLTLCIGLTAAASMKRQDIATPPAPTAPPTDQDAGTTQDMKTPPPPSAGTPMATDAPDTNTTQESMTTAINAGDDMTTMATDSTRDSSSNDNVTTPEMTSPVTSPETTPTSEMTGPTTTPEPTTTTTTETTTTTPEETTIVSVDEIVSVFAEVAESQYFKRLPYADQLLVLELVSGAESGKMTPVLEEIGYERLLSFMYDLPLKYQDNTYLLIESGFKREKLLMKS